MNHKEEKFIEELYLSVYTTLIDYGRKSLYEQHYIEESIQETFRIACENVSTIMSYRVPSAWVMNTFKNIIRDVYREKARDSELIARLESEQSTRRPAGPGYTDEENPDVLYGDIANSEDYILLKKLSDSRGTIVELSEELGISVEACKKRVQRARKRLQKYFEDF